MDKDKTIRIEAHNSAILVSSDGNTITNGAELSELDRELLRIFKMLPMQCRIKFMSYAYDVIDQALHEKSPPPDGERLKKPVKEPAKDYLFAANCELTPAVLAEIDRFAEYTRKSSKHI